MPPTELDRARAAYLAALHQCRPTLDARIKDLAVVFGQILAAEPPGLGHPAWLAMADQRPLAAIEPA